MLKTDIKKDVLIGLILWIAGSTVVGIPIVHGIIGYRGFCFGYTIAAILAVIGAKQGILISIIGIFLQNIVFIPSIILIAVSGSKLYKKIIKIKIEKYKIRNLQAFYNFIIGNNRNYNIFIYRSFSINKLVNFFCKIYIKLQKKYLHSHKFCDIT